MENEKLNTEETANSDLGAVSGSALPNAICAYHRTLSNDRYILHLHYC